MAGSFRHIVDRDNGNFTMDLIENLGDAEEALEECFQIITKLSDGDRKKVSSICRDLSFPDPYKHIQLRL